MSGLLLTLTVYTQFTLLVDVTWSVSSFHFVSKLQTIPRWTKMEQKIIDSQFKLTRHRSGSKSRVDFKFWQWVPHKIKTSFNHFEFGYIKIVYFKKCSAKTRQIHKLSFLEFIGILNLNLDQILISLKGNDVTLTMTFGM